MKLCQQLNERSGGWWEWLDDSHGTFELSDIVRQAVSYFCQKYKADPKAIYINKKSRTVYLWRRDLLSLHAAFSARKDKFEPVLPKPVKPLLVGTKVSKGSIMKGTRKRNTNKS